MAEIVESRKKLKKKCERAAACSCVVGLAVSGKCALFVTPKEPLLGFPRVTGAAHLIHIQASGQGFSCGRLLLWMFLPWGALLEKQSYFFHPLTSDQWVKLIIFVFYGPRLKRYPWCPSGRKKCTLRALRTLRALCTLRRETTPQQQQQQHQPVEQTKL